MLIRGTCARPFTLEVVQRIVDDVVTPNYIANCLDYVSRYPLRSLFAHGKGQDPATKNLPLQLVRPESFES